jgi:bifunctional DNA-binding transcriptional regulator/antitoxin component of YhaV-PrlF toxin-antitoxin module
MAEVKNRRRRGQSRISSKNQVTIPVEALRAAGLEPGDEVRIEAKAPGRIVLYRLDDVIAKYAGDLTGVYEPGYLEQLRNEWR